jgi:hypothetical protein
MQTMSEPKPIASLSSGLLARKGAAKPAMRPQGFAQVGGGSLEDLGWNDMGAAAQAQPATFDEGPLEHVPSSIAALTPAPKSQDDAPKSPPVVVEQQRAIAERFDVEPVIEDEIPLEETIEEAPVVQIPRRPRQAPGLKAKAAFTLRLDPDRHLKLRLACAVRHRSAQQIVSDALDAFLKSLPELDALAEQVPAQAGKRN